MMGQRRNKDKKAASIYLIGIVLSVISTIGAESLRDTLFAAEADNGKARQESTTYRGRPIEEGTDRFGKTSESDHTRHTRIHTNNPLNPGRHR